MSTQVEPGIEFAIVPEENRQHFRLLELPPDLLAVITSDDPPTLQLKSQEGPPGHALESNAVLCTPDKTYTIRQVSTSNEVYLAHASSNSDSFPPQPRLEAIAKYESTLELQVAKNVSPIPYIKAALPIYATTGHYNSKAPLSKTELFGNIPASDAECAQAWQDLACSELQTDNESRCVIPSNGVKLKIWQAFLESATAKAIDMTAPVDSHDAESITKEHDDWPSELVIAVLRSMCSNDDANFSLDETKCTRAVGEMLLRERTDNGRTYNDTQALIQQWADILPEKWRARAEIRLLEGLYILENDGREIKFVESSATSASSGSAAPPAEAKASLGAKRKWHEKFRASKKTA